jgi:succinoglycan biosynthesis protein ExoA
MPVIDCSVLVPVLNEERSIDAAFAAMRGQRFDGQLEFIFADGGSTDRTRAILESWAGRDPRLRIYDNPNRTVSSGLNVALGQARGRWIARMDAHTEYGDDYLSLGIKRLQAGGTRWVSGPPLPEGHGRVSRAVALALGTGLGRSGSRKWARQGAPSDAEYELDSGVFTGVWERSTLLAYGGWDERWKVNEDSEMAGRFLEQGERLICLPAMAASYAPRNSLIGLGRQYLVYGEYRIKTARRHPRTLRRHHLIAPVLVLDAAIAVCSPSRWRRPARFGLALYGLVLGREGARSLSHAEHRSDAALVPLALATMHIAWGVGTWLGMARFGAPIEAVSRIVHSRKSEAGDAPRSPDEQVYSPSLKRQAGAALAVT